MTPETLADLGVDDTFDELRILVADPTLDRDGITKVADDVRARLERSGARCSGRYVPPPGEHPANELLQGFFLVLGVIGALALIMSGFLVVNTIAAILAQQTRQIGVMKAIGARDDQVAGLYLGLVLAYAVLALLVALPLGALGAWGFTIFTAGLANFDVTEFAIPPMSSPWRSRVGLLVPLLAALVPIWRGVRVTVREALASTGIADTFGRGRLDRVLRDVRGLSRPTLISIRNTFRRKGRLALTLAALSLGGAVFMSVFSVRASLQQTLEDTLRYFAYDVQVELSRPERVDGLTASTLAVPGVSAAEPWQFATVQRIRADGSEGARSSRSACRPTRSPCGPPSSRAAGSCPATATPSSPRPTCSTTSRTCGSATRSPCASTGRTRPGRSSASSHRRPERPFLYTPAAPLGARDP